MPDDPAAELANERSTILLFCEGDAASVLDLHGTVILAK
jgi:hypothetical protein